MCASHGEGQTEFVSSVSWLGLSTWSLGSVPRLGSSARSLGSVSRLGRSTQFLGLVSRLCLSTRSPDSVSRLGLSTRSLDPVPRLSLSTLSLDSVSRLVSWLVASCNMLLACLLACCQGDEAQRVQLDWFLGVVSLLDLGVECVCVSCLLSRSSTSSSRMPQLDELRFMLCVHTHLLVKVIIEDFLCVTLCLCLCILHVIVLLRSR